MRRINVDWNNQQNGKNVLALIPIDDKEAVRRDKARLQQWQIIEGRGLLLGDLFLPALSQASP